MPTVGAGFELEYFIKSYAASAGLGAATELINQAARESGFVGKKVLDKDEALRLCEHLAERSGYIRTIASALKTRIILQHAGLSVKE